MSVGSNYSVETFSSDSPDHETLRAFFFRQKPRIGQARHSRERVLLRFLT